MATFRPAVRRIGALASLCLFLILCPPAHCEELPLQVYGTADNGAGVIGAWTCVNGKEIKDRFSYYIHLGDTVCLWLLDFDQWLLDYGDLPDDMRKAAGSPQALPPAELIAKILPRLRLVIDDHILQTIPASRFYFQAFERDGRPSTYTYLYFTLQRDSGSAPSRADWKPILRLSGITPPVSLNVALLPSAGGIAKAPPSWVRPGETAPERTFYFQRIYMDGWFYAGVVLFLAALAIFFVLAARTNLLRDPSHPAPPGGPLPPFSLGRCQMAFWFFLIAAAFFLIWLVTGRGDLDTITPGALTMLGISAATGFGSVFIASATGTSTQPPAPSVRGFWGLICEADGTVSLPRFQNVIWTAILGIIFASAVWDNLAMPDFDTTLLLLMGISSGTYLGFKFQSANKPAPSS